MEGIYTPSQLALREQQRRRSQQQAQTQANRQSAAQLSAAAATAAPVGHSRMQPTPIVTSHNPGQESLEYIMRENENLIRENQDLIRENEDLIRRRSMPARYSHLSGMTEEANAQRMPIMEAQEMMVFGNPNGSVNNYQFLDQLTPSFPTLNNAGGVGGYMNDLAYSNVSQEAMNTMISPQFADMDMSAMFSAPPDGNTDFTSTHESGFGGIEKATDLAKDMSTQALNSAASLALEDTVTEHQFNQIRPSSHETNSLNADARNANSSGLSTNAQSLLSKQQSSTSATLPDSLPISTTSAAAATSSIPEIRGKTLYSKSGFDMLKALWLVATRKDPKINLGAVDMSCAFVVSDVTMNDCPIVYVSDNFQNLTGYSRHDIIGQNCRFLQAPDGKVEQGTKREFVDNGAVYNLKQMIEQRKEVQQSIINYRKGGKPFLNMLTMIPIPWDGDDIRYFVGFQIDLVECPDAIASGQELGTVAVNYKHTDIGQYIWNPPNSNYWDSDTGQTLGVDDVSTLLQQFSPKGMVSDWHKQSWDKMLLENSDDVIHVLSLKGLFLYLSPACRRILEYDGSELVGNSLSSICHPSDIVPVTRELKEATTGGQVNIVFRIRRKQSGYTWFESHGSLYIEQGKGRKCIILVGRKRPVFALNRRYLEANGGIGDSEIWTKLSTSGMFLFVSSNVRSLLDLQPESLVGTSIQELMRKESRPEFGRSMEKARRGKIVTCKHEVQNRRGQGLQAQTVLYPGDASEGQKPSFLLAQTKLLKASSRNLTSSNAGKISTIGETGESRQIGTSEAMDGSLTPGNQDAALASDDNIFDELRTTKCSSWQFELRQMEKVNRILAEELGGLLSNKKKRKRRKGSGNAVRDCANCHTRNTPEWRRGPSGQRDLCNSCGLRWAKQVCFNSLFLASTLSSGINTLTVHIDGTSFSSYIFTRW